MDVKIANVIHVSAETNALAKQRRRKRMAEVAKGPGGAYWMVVENDQVISTHPTKEEAEKAAKASKPATYSTKMATAENST